MNTPQAGTVNPRVVPESDAAISEWFDVIAVGGGAAAFAAAVAAASAGRSVLLLEKADHIGGTTRKAAAWYWVPNNDYMRELGLEDSKESVLHYVARLTKPHRYNPDAPLLGLDQWEYDLVDRFYDEAAGVVRTLTELDALVPVHNPEFPDYYAQLRENQGRLGRLLMPARFGAGASDIGTGVDMIDQFAFALGRLGGEIRTSHRVTRLLVAADGSVSGVVADRDGEEVAFGARGGVVFGTGGFTHNRPMRDRFLSGPFFGGCAAKSNTGDFLPLAQAMGADLANMNYAWMASVPLELALADEPGLTSTFFMAGDSMVIVNREGRRVMNEKSPYNEVPMVMHTWDPATADYPNLLLFMVWDQAAQDHYATETFGNPITPMDGDRRHVVTAATIDRLAAELRTRLDSLAAHTGGFALRPEFADQLRETVEQFNRYAADGVDPDFGRGTTPLQRHVYGDPRPGNDADPTMFPIDPEGPYYATILSPATLDTKGGPICSTDGEVLDVTGRPIKGLYGAGNCVASPSGQAYWAGGATIGPAITFGYLAGRHAADRCEAKLSTDSMETAS